MSQVYMHVSGGVQPGEGRFGRRQTVANGERNTSKLRVGKLCTNDHDERNPCPAWADVWRSGGERLAALFENRHKQAQARRSDRCCFPPLILSGPKKDHST